MLLNIGFACARSTCFSPEARGFVESSYPRGLTPQEFFSDAMVDCEGLIDTAVTTAETRYIQRLLVKVSEDIIASVHYSLSDLVQITYHGGVFIESQYIETFGVSDITGLASQIRPVAPYQVLLKSALTTSSAEL
jgi:DNA-directed RNA polymerase beta' subunit